MKNKVGRIIGIVLSVGIVAGIIYFQFIAPPNWKTGAESAATGEDDDGNPWMGATKPKLIIHEYLDYNCPHCSGAHQIVRSLIARDLDTIRLVRHDYARSQCHFKLGTKMIKQCTMVRAAHCAAKHMSYWKWNDALIEEPRHRSGMDEMEYIDSMIKRFKLPENKMKDCIDGDEAAEKAETIFQYTKAAGISATPSYIIGGKMYNLEELVDFLGSR